MSQNTTEGLPRWTIAMIILCGAVSCYFALNSGFMDDDFTQLWNTRHPLWQSLYHALAAPDMFSDMYYRPLTRVIHRLLFATLDASAIAHHGFSILVHLLNSVLVWRLGRRMGAPENVARIAAIVFAIHPVHVEPVTSISALGGLLAGTFVFLSLIAYLRYLKGDPGRWGSVAVMTSVLGLLCKEDVISLPLSLGVVWWLYARDRRHTWWPAAAMIPVIAVWLVWRVAIGGTLAAQDAHFSLNPLTVFRNLPFHVTRMLVSVRSLFRVTDFDWYYRVRDALPPLPNSPVYVAVVLLIVAALAYVVWRRWSGWPRYIRAGFLLCVSTLALYLPLRESATRFLYIPVAGLAIAVVGLLLNKSRVRRAILVVWMLVLSVSLVEQTSTWYGARAEVEKVLAQAVDIRQAYPPDVGTVFADYPRRYYAATVFASSLPEAICWTTQYDWPYLYGYRDVPFETKTVVPDSVVWFRWQDNRFELYTPADSLR